ncbi:MAG: hypothetical protein GKR91_17650 [Pseudomonadales bacterium]|nr:hypothetical protein [Pseudomonadales bacterium]
MRKNIQTLLSAFCISLLCGIAFSQQLGNEELIPALRNGGYIIFMRHANAPGELPTAETAAPGNSNLERQLDEKGRFDARNFGEAIRRLQIPILTVERSPTFRTRQTAEHAGFGDVLIQDFLLEERMVGVTPARLERLKEELTKKPASGNRLFISHSGNIKASFPELDPRIEQGEALIIDPTQSNNVLIARVKITEWVDF